MKIMKFALHMHNKEDISSIYEAVKKMDLPYNQLDLDNVMNNDLPMKRNFILSDPESFGSLKPVITMNGICEAWIPYKVQSPYKQSKFISDFENVFGNNISKELPIGLESNKIFRFVSYENNYISNLMKSSFR